MSPSQIEQIKGTFGGNFLVPEMKDIVMLNQESEGSNCTMNSRFTGELQIIIKDTYNMGEEKRFK